MKSLSSLLLKRKQKTRPALIDKDIFHVFKKIIREDFGRLGAAKFHPDYYKRGTIFVRSDSSVWASELFTNRNRIIQKINKELREEAVKEIKMK